MQPAELLKYIENPQSLSKQSVKQLQKLVNDFPYFQPAHILLSMAAKKWDASAYQQSLKKTAIVVTNRAHLFKLIHQFEIEALPQVKEITETIPEVKIEETKAESGAHELNILKATEVSAEQAQEEKNTPAIKPALNPEEILELEIGNQVVNAFVEKEILKTNELNRPRPKEAESFVEWLSLLKKNNGQSYQQIEEQVQAEKQRHRTLKPKEEKSIPPETPANLNKKEKNRALIDKIIESSPGIIRSKEDQKFFAAEIKAKESLLENEHLVTETLARIYALQGSVNKAVRAYEILSLKFPQKSAYFATLIEKLKHGQ
ncbi:MAG TPA: hypothetical protein PL029_01590 [Bacteroidia bacterium]|nr:hypothetical protein [Bacteroidia bacterium]